MPTFCQHTAFSTDDQDPIGTTYDIPFIDTATGIPFQPSFVFFYWGGLPFSTQQVLRSDLNFGMGFATSPTERRYISFFSEDAVATTVTKRAGNPDAVVIQLDPGAEALMTLGRIDIDAFTATGIRLIVDEVFNKFLNFGMLGIGGDVDAAEIVDYLMADDACATDPVDVTGFGFDPLLGISLGFALDVVGIADNGAINLGSFRTTGEQGVWGGASADALGTSDTARQTRYGDIAIARVLPTGAIIGRNSFNSFITDGFRFNCLEDAPELVFILGMAGTGTNFAILDFLTRTTLGTIVLSPGFAVSGGIIISANGPEALDNDSQSVPKTMSISIGSFSGVAAAQQKCFYGHDQNEFGTTRCISGVRAGSVYMRSDRLASPGLDGSIEVTTIDLGGDVTLTQSVIDPDAAHCIAILFGDRGVPAIPDSGHIEYDGVDSHANWIRRLH